jgi:hypothetical protein
VQVGLVLEPREQRPILGPGAGWHEVDVEPLTVASPEAFSPVVDPLRDA